MTQPAQPPAPPPAPAPQAAEAPAAAPAPAKPPAPAAPKVTVHRPGDGPRKVVTRPHPTYSAPTLPAPAAPPVSPPPAASASDKPAEATPPAAAPTPPKPADAAAPPEPPKAEAKPPEPKITEAEEARRIARIHRQEAKLSEERQRFAQERAAHAQDVQRVRILEQLRTKPPPPADRLQLIETVFGWRAQDILDAVIAQGAQTPEQKAAATAAATAEAERQRLAQLEQTVQNGIAEQRRREEHAQLEAYKATAVAQTLADKTRHPNLHRALGDEAVNEVFALQEARYNESLPQIRQGLRASPEVLTPQQAADIIEAYFKQLHDKLAGTNVAPAPAPATPKVEPPPASASGSQTATAHNAAFRPFAKSYTTKVVR